MSQFSRVAEIVELLVSPFHRFAGRPDEAAAGIALADGAAELVDRIELRAGLGIVGDRYFNRPAHRDASVTLIAAESLDAYPGVGLTAVRRNVLLRGIDVDAMIGHTVQLDSGDGPVRLRVHRAANPCRWLDVAVAPGAWRELRGHGGVRCEPLTDGRLGVGAVEATWLE